MRIGIKYYTLGKDSKNYLILPKEFEAEGWQFSQIKREKDVALYSKTKDKFKTYELIIVQYYESYQIVDNFVPAKQSWPSDESFGTLAWAYTTLEDAEKRFLSLTSKH